MFEYTLPGPYSHIKYPIVKYKLVQTAHKVHMSASKCL